jgi:hypothetical protein
VWQAFNDGCITPAERDDLLNKLREALEMTRTEGPLNMHRDPLKVLLPVLAAVVAAGLLFAVGSFLFKSTTPTPFPSPTPTPFPSPESVPFPPPTPAPFPSPTPAPFPPSPTPDIADVAKKDCQHLVEGQLVFAPRATMRQGQSYALSARLGRGPDTHITVGLSGPVVIENTQVSCMVSMTLDSQEPEAFRVENIPAGRKDDQILIENSFAQWDWRVTPKKAGTLHLLLYVTPMLYVDGVGQGLKQFPQPPRIITVSPDRVYATKQVLITYWAVWTVLLTAIIIPTFVWIVRKMKARREIKAQAKKTPPGFGTTRS